jgi:sucrose-6-phosphate hydrolase SacC (GH32 family)
MKRILTLSALLFAPLASVIAADDDVLLFSFFRGNGEAGTYLAWSEDGVKFATLNDDKPIFLPAPWPGQNLTRDPSIIYRDGKFRAVWTSSWKGRVFGYAESPNLVHWSEPLKVKPFPDSLPAEDQPQNVWAPEIHWNPAQKNYAILFSTTTDRESRDGDGSNNNGKDGNDHRIYITRTADGNTFTPATLFFDQGFSVIDAQMALDGRRWVMAVKHEQEIPLGGKNLRLTFAPLDLSKPWSPASAPVFGPGSPIRPHEKVEGACLVKWKGRWHLYTDAFANHHYSMATSPDLKTWTDRTDALILPPNNPRHGTIFRAPRSAVGFLETVPVQRPAMYFGDDTRHGRPFAKDPSVIRFGGRYLLYYSMAPSTNKAAPKGWAIGIAESRDLVNWKKVGEILPEQECEKNGIVNGRIILLDGKLHLFYNTYGNRAKDALCHATSADGLRFTRNPTNPVWHPTGDWNNGRAIDVDVIEWGDKLIMYYATRDPAGKIQMLHAIAADRKSGFGRSDWKSLCDGPVLKPELPWETNCIEAPSVVKRGDTLYLFYGGGYNNDPQQIGCATSKDGIHFQRLFTDKPLLANGPPGSWNSSESGHPGMFEDDDGQLYMFYQGNNDKGRTWFLSCVKIGWNGDRPQVISGNTAR